MLKFCGELMFEDDVDEDDDSVASEIMDLETFCKTLNDSDYEQPHMSFGEKAAMITINEKYSRGSVEVARGRRMTVMASQKGSRGTQRKIILKELKKRQTAPRT